RGGMIPAMVFTNRLFPPFAIDQAFIEKAQESAQQAPPVVRNTLLERADIVSRMLHSRSFCAAPAAVPRPV
ncbi:MAG: hypothetical protein QOG10_878, partial [Kribbellaceae bacterium]|nr:hypothetical protein [Kribbellaceae bacterium]